MRNVHNISELFQVVRDEHSPNLQMVLNNHNNINQVQQCINLPYQALDNNVLEFNVGDHALNYAIRTGHYKRAVVLMELGADLCHNTDHTGQTAFQILTDKCVNSQQLQAVKLVKHITTNFQNLLVADTRDLLTIGKRCEALKNESKKWPSNKIYATIFSLSVAAFDSIVTVIEDTDEDVGALSYVAYGFYIFSLIVSIINLYDSHDRLHEEEKELRDVNDYPINKPFLQRTRGWIGSIAFTGSLCTKTYALFFGPSGACGQTCNSILNNLGPLLLTSSIELCTTSMEREAAYLEDRTTFGR